MRRRQTGLSLPEIMIASSLFLVLTVLLFAGWGQGMRGWLLVTERNKVTTQAQRLIRLLERGLENSTAQSIDLEHTPISVLSYSSSFAPLDTGAQQEFVADSVTGILQWQKYVVVYHDPDSKIVFRREIAVDSTEQAYYTVAPLSTLPIASGPRPLVDHAKEGDPIAHNIDELNFTLDGVYLHFSVLLTTDEERQLRFESSTRMRNS